MDKSKEMVTIFQETIVPEFVIRLKDNEVAPPLRTPTRANTFYMMLSSKSDKLTKFWLELIDGRIYMKNAPENQVLAFIDIAYSRIKLLKNTEVFGKHIHGIRFIKAKNYEEIFHTELSVIVDWFEVLKRYCVMSKFREIYKIKNMIGKGNFAKVYVTTRLEDQKDFAAKIFDKKLIVQDKFERVGGRDAAMPAVRAEDDARGLAPEPALDLGDLRGRQQHLLSGPAVLGRQPQLGHPR